MQTYGSVQHETLTGAGTGAIVSHGECRTDNLILSDEEETDNAKICVYSNVNYTETVTI